METKLHKPPVFVWMPLIFVALCFAPTAAWSEYPRLSSLSSTDVIYKQHQSGVEQYYRSSRTGGDLPELAIYSYEPKEGETLITIASKLTIPYSAIASLNRISNTNIPDGRETLLIPNLPGIFLPENPTTELEHLMWDHRQDKIDEAGHIFVTLEGKRQRFRFFAGSKFNQMERLAFLRLLFQRPVRDARVSSHYGFRNSPVTGNAQFHGGIDFPADSGTDVYAARGGRVSGTGVDPLYGNYVRIEHDGAFETFYGHLGEVKVGLNDQVSSSTIIGYVGNSGRSTGPHLHFEIRQHDKRRDPLHHLLGPTR